MACLRVMLGQRRLTVPGGVVGSYLHASPSPGTGRMGALVGLACQKAQLSDEVLEICRVRHTLMHRKPHVSPSPQGPGDSQGWTRGLIAFSPTCLISWCLAHQSLLPHDLCI